MIIPLVTPHCISIYLVMMLKAPVSGSSTTTKSAEGSPSAAMEKKPLVPPADEAVATTSVALSGADGFQQRPAKTTPTINRTVDLDLDGDSKQASRATSTGGDTRDEVRLVSEPTVEAKAKAVQQELEGNSDRESKPNASKSPQEEVSHGNVARPHRDHGIGSIIGARSQEEEEADGTTTNDVSHRGCDSGVTALRSLSIVGERAIQDREEETPDGERVAGVVGNADAPSTLELAEKALVALYEVHDKFFSADKGEKEVGELALSFEIVMIVLQRLDY